MKSTKKPPRSRDLNDSFGRTIDYLRLSVTDRCDFRCFYCIGDKVTFLPKPDVLSLEELDRLCSLFIDQGVRKLRLTGGEPLVRRGILTLISDLSRHLESGRLREITLTTNGSQLAKMATALANLGVMRINISLDTLRAERFTRITGKPRFAQVLDGIETALKAGIKLKVNTVALKGVNDDEFDDLIRFCHEREMDLTIIETMPMGGLLLERPDVYLPLSEVQEQLTDRWSLIKTDHRSSGPASYFTVGETGGRVGFIAPMTHNFCDSCNRVRLSCTGILYTCLGRNNATNLRTPLRTSQDDAPIIKTIRKAIANKPEGHDFNIKKDRNYPVLERQMSVTGG
ncbi:cyclic pyranopterin phosphate synthase [Cohaesibacter marisflavi]|uniref:GTP 3',8-cyclase n=1 Tax=Cohaesibacter marisflavi TaxID=655353 RepID=A0A1I5LVP3_9HYPH|nr:GTP 3',8-cyclase MoaA [Cohaesibacter marisflavi]SFP00821.1 cyclic pyranopterin phosphate synthase [Cohaesibacter marisflavi]